MRKWAMGGGAAWALLLAAPGIAQPPATPQMIGNSAMPGQVVSTFNGTGQFPRVGQQLPPAAPPAGLPAAGLPGRPFDPTRPYEMFRGTNIDPRSVLAPVIGPDGKPIQPPDALDRLSQKIKDFFSFSSGPSLPPPPNFAPGIIRRRKERIEERMWRRD